MSVTDRRSTAGEIAATAYEQVRDTPVPLLASSLLVVLLFANLLLRATESPDWFMAYQFNLLYLGTAVVLLFAHAYVRPDWDPWQDLWRHVAQLGLAMWIVFVFNRQHVQYIPPEGRTTHVVAIFVLFLAFAILGYDTVGFLRRKWQYVLAVATLLGVYFYHVDGIPAGSGKASFVVWVALVVALNVLYIPRYVPRNVFLWGTSAASAFVVGVGLPAYLVGSYELLSFPVQLYPAKFAVPLLGTKLNFLQSIFDNPNGLGLLAFAGTFAAFALACDASRKRRPTVVSVAGALVVLNGIGLYASYSRASWLAAGVAAIILLSGVRFGRRAVPYTIVAIGSLTALFLLALYTSVLPVASHGRFALWEGALGAVANAPSPFGYGVVDTGEVIEPYVSDPQYRGYSPHNSYSEIFLQTGIVGGLAYLGLIFGSIADGMWHYERTDVVMLAFAVGFAVQQLFEGYSLVNVAIGSVLASLVVGYVVVQRYDE